MNWTREALSLVEAAPPAVQPMIRRRVEAMAARRNVREITPAFLMAARSEAHAALPVAAGSDEIDIQPLLAREGGDALTDAFEVGDDIHVFAAGQPLSPGETARAWYQAEHAAPPAGVPRCLYVHVPFCRSRCVFCPFYANRWTPDAGGRYADAVVREIERLGDTPLANRPLDAVYFGGGTPSDLAPLDLARVLGAVRESFVLAVDAEVTLEARVWGHNRELISAALHGGVNRFSVGVQSFDTALRRSIGRKGSREEVVAFLNDLAASPAAVVIDLIFGLPGQTMEQWQEDLRCLAGETSIHGVDLYRLKSVPGSVMDEMIAAGRLPVRPGLAESAAMFAAGVEAMKRRGWERLSVSHWRRDGRERSRYNTLVKTGADCIPVGCGAGGRVAAVRFFQAGDLDAYFRAIAGGRKPIASAVRLGRESGVVDCITSQLEHGRLAPARWALPKSPLGLAADRLLGQWARAGLLSRDCGGEFVLTTAGQFWQVQMGVRLARLAQAASTPPESGSTST